MKLLEESIKIIFMTLDLTVDSQDIYRQEHKQQKEGKLGKLDSSQFTTFMPKRHCQEAAKTLGKNTDRS